MKIIRRMLAAIGVLFVGWVIVSLLLDGSHGAKSSTFIKAPADIVFQRVADFQHWKAWNVWDQKAANAITSHAEAAAALGPHPSLPVAY